MLDQGFCVYSRVLIVVGFKCIALSHARVRVCSTSSGLNISWSCCVVSLLCVSQQRSDGLLFPYG